MILDSSLEKVDEFLHISRRMRRDRAAERGRRHGPEPGRHVLAAAGYLPPVAGAVAQELIDVAAVVNALRAALPPRQMYEHVTRRQAFPHVRDYPKPGRRYFGPRRSDRPAVLKTTLRRRVSRGTSLAHSNPEGIPMARDLPAPFPLDPVPG